MTKSEEIFKRQNEENMLRYQFASRQCYNRAERYNRSSWIFCLLSWATFFLPSSEPYDTITICVTSAIDFLALFLSWRFNENIKKASSMRNYFDSYVLGTNKDLFSNNDKIKLKEYAVREEHKAPKKYIQQIQHTGHDNPPGVLDWYEFSSPLEGENAIYECMRQNCWWNNKLTKIRIVLTSVFLFIMLFICGLFKIKFFASLSITRILLSSSPIILRIVERIVQNIHYLKLSVQISGGIKIVERSKTIEAINSLQELINKRRTLPVLENNSVHRCVANAFSNLNLEITNN